MPTMTQQAYADSIAVILRSIAPNNRLRAEDVGLIDQLAAQWARRDNAAGAPAVTVKVDPVIAGKSGPLASIADLQARIGAVQSGAFDLATREALLAHLINKHAPGLTDAQVQQVADDLGVSPKLIRAIRKVEAPRGAYDDDGRPSILYEKHVFGKVTGHRFDASHPVLSSRKWQPGTYGTFAAQYGKLADACALDPDAAFQACSWGAFQILGTNAIALGYPSAFDMAIAMTKGELAHLESFIRFIKVNNLTALLRKCRPGDPTSCIPFVRAYNGEGYARNRYHIKLAEAAR